MGVHAHVFVCVCVCVCVRACLPARTVRALLVVSTCARQQGSSRVLSLFPSISATPAPRYVDCTSMAARSVAAVKEGRLKLIPAVHEQTWFHWLEDIRPWCISRQLWWGHRIPAYQISIDGKPLEPPADAGLDDRKLARCVLEYGYQSVDVT